MFDLILHNEVPKEISDLPKVTKVKLIRLIERLKIDPNSLREPHSKPLNNGLFEIRTMGTNIARDLYVYKKNRKIYLLRVFIKKTQKTPVNEIQIALKRLEDLNE